MKIKKEGMMNSSDKENLEKSDPKTKEDLKKGTSNSNRTPEKQRKMQENLRNALENANAGNTNLKEKEKELEALQKELENAKNTIKEKEKELAEKAKELETLRNELEKAKATLKAKLKELEKAKATIKAKMKALEKAKTTISKKEKELETLNSTDISNAEETLLEHSRPGKEAFRIDLYPYEGHYQGKVVHVMRNYTPILDEQRQKSFKGLDHKAIADFMNEHLPQPDKSSDATEPVASESLDLEPVAREPEKSPSETQTRAVKSAIIRKFSLVQEDMFQNGKFIPRDHIFQLELLIDPKESIGEDTIPCNCSISVLAKRMGGGFKGIIGKSKETIETTGEFAANVYCSSLPTGIYRFVAFGDICIKKEGQETFIQFQESSVFIVA